MKSDRRSATQSEKDLCILARDFRSTRDDDARRAIAAEYAATVEKLIDSDKWKKIPTLEDQLPDEWMPGQFFEFWSLEPPVRRLGGQEFHGEMS